jgi:RNA polymerase sigma factor (TIGR02999 family)
MSDPINIDDVQQFMTELRLMAQTLLRNEGEGGSVRATGLIMTALRRNKREDQEWGEVTWQNRQYFFGAMHQAMRRALIDYARKRSAARRPKLQFVQPEDLNLFDIPATLENHPRQIEALEEALSWLEQRSGELAEIVQLRYFNGFSVEETARWLGNSDRTVKRKWVQARLLLHDKILNLLNGPK